MAVKGLKYSKEHEWVKVEGNRAYIGITDYAQNALGDVVYIELPEEGAELGAGDTAAVVESIKAASDIYMPVSGKIVQVNRELADAPEKINSEPYESWIALVEMTDEAQLGELMECEEYEKFCAGEA